jgi:hypothetical protein
MESTRELLKEISRDGLQSMGLYFGKYRGFVEDVNDPEDAGRIKISCPQVFGEDVVVDYWAYSFGMFSGHGYGLILPVKKGDMIWVEFEGGNPSYPVWTYGHFGSNDKPSEHQNNEQYLFVSPGGSFIMIDDKKGEIIVNRKGGGKTVINDKGISFVRDGEKISIGGLNNSDEPAVLGDKNESVLTDIAQDISKLLIQFSAFTAAVGAESAANAAVLPPLAPASATLLSAITTINTQITTISQNISLLLGGKIATTKSKNVSIDG